MVWAVADAANAIPHAGGPMNDEDPRVHFSEVAAKAVAAALRLARSEMPKASDARLLLLILGNAAACCGRLRIEYDDVMSLTSGLYKEGAGLPPLPGSRPRFEI
jgi:hypothetical protein